MPIPCIHKKVLIPTPCDRTVTAKWRTGPGLHDGNRRCRATIISGISEHKKTISRVKPVRRTRGQPVSQSASQADRRTGGHTDTLAAYQCSNSSTNLVPFCFSMLTVPFNCSDNIRTSCSPNPLEFLKVPDPGSPIPLSWTLIVI